MKDFFEIIESKENDNKMGISLGIRLKIGDHETICPILGITPSFETFNTEIQILKKGLDNVLNKAKHIFEGDTSDSNIALNANMTPNEIWEILSSMVNVNAIVDGFNSLNMEKRKEVAEYILTRCNIFSGTGSVFSSRYNNESGFLE